jgi:putative transposase
VGEHDVGGLDGEHFRAAVLERLLTARAAGSVSNAAVGQTAEACGVSERTIRRWLQRGQIPQRASWAWTPTARTTDLLERWRGNVAAVHRQLVEEGERVPSRRTVARALERELRPVEREHPRRGVAAVRDRSVYLRHAARHRAECYEADHKELSIEVLPPRGTRPRRPWVTVFTDQFSRLVVGWAISLCPTQAEVLAALRMAVTVDPARGRFGGVPATLRWDRGLEFAAVSIEQATQALGCVSRCTDAYSPWQKGKVERLNRTIEQTLLQGLPGWTGGPRDDRGRLVGEPPLTLERFVAVFADWVAEYNTRRPHDGLSGRTPLDAWMSDATRVRALGHEQARWMLLARTRRRVLKDGIHHGGRIYFAPELSGLGGETVEVAQMPHDPRFIEIFHRDRWLATARPQTDLTAADRRDALERRRADARELEARARRARRRARMRLAPITAPGPIEDIVSPPLTPKPTVRPGRASLRLLGLDDAVNQPRDDSSARARNGSR